MAATWASSASLAIRRLTVIRRCRDFGFTIEQVRELVGLVDEPNRDCVEVRDIAQAHLQEVQKKLAELRALKASLAAFVCSCNTACAGGPAIDCTILEDLTVPAPVPQREKAGYKAAGLVLLLESAAGRHSHRRALAL